MDIDKKHYHDKGQGDAESNVYKRPLNGIGDILILPLEVRTEANRAYSDGFFHGRGQIDANEGRYEPPNDPQDREAYDAGVGRRGR